MTGRDPDRADSGPQWAGGPARNAMTPLRRCWRLLPTAAAARAGCRARQVHRGFQVPAARAAVTAATQTSMPNAQTHASTRE